MCTCSVTSTNHYPTGAPTHAPALQVGPWTSQIIEGILKKLAALQKPMKYVCHVSLTQRAGAGLHAAAASRWNAKTDGGSGRGRARMQLHAAACMLPAGCLRAHSLMFAP